jgi:thioredoxin reductase (NADPH)
MVRKVIILGSGPAGYTAALYTARAKLNPLLLSGDEPGGQLMLTGEVENYPGFSNGIQGPELIETMRQQAERFGAEIRDEKATAVEFKGNPLKVKMKETVYESEAVIVATGASARWLGLESEARLRGRGVSACATCDGPLFKNLDVVVVGGGDTAVDDALFLTKFTDNVTIVHRRDQFRASRILQERVFRNNKIQIRWNTVVTEILGETTVQGVELQDVKTGRKSQLKCSGVFVAIGHVPNTEIFKGQLEMDERGYLVTKRRTETDVEGVFAAGDVQDHLYRQAVVAAGSGCMAALDVERYLESKMDSMN